MDGSLVFYFSNGERLKGRSFSFLLALLILVAFALSLSPNKIQADISPNTVTTASGATTQHSWFKKVLRTSDGTIHAVLAQTGSIEHYYSYNDGVSWSNQTISSTSYDCSFDKDSNDNLVVVYGGSSNTFFKKATVTKGTPWTWSWGAQKTVDSSVTCLGADIVVDGNDYYHVVIRHATSTGILYFRSDMWDASFYKLLTANTASETSVYNSAGVSYLGIRVFKDDTTELTDGIPLARKQAPAEPALVSATWSFPATSSVSYLTVYVYNCNSAGGSATLLVKFKTDTFNLDSLANQTWTVYYFCDYDGVSTTTFYYGASTANSRISFSPISPKWCRCTDGAGDSWTSTDLCLGTSFMATIVKDSSNNLFVFSGHQITLNNGNGVKITYNGGTSWTIGIVYVISGASCYNVNAHILSNNTLVITYCITGLDLYFRKSTSASDVSAWGSSVLVKASIDTQYYHSMMIINNSQIRVYYCDGTDLCYKESTDSGDSFGVEQVVYSTGTDTYPNIAKTIVNSKIDYVWTNSLPAIYHSHISLNNAPTNDALSLDLTGANYKDTKTLLCGKEDYKFVYNVTDADGVTDITYAQIQLDTTGKNVILRATRGSGDSWTFSEESDPSNYVTLNVGGSSHSTSGNQKTFNFLVTINWAWGDSAETVGVRCYVIDSQSASDTDDYSNIFGVEAHLTSASLSVNDYNCNPSQTLTFTGSWKYDGTSIAPPDGNYNVVIKLSSVQKGSGDTTLVNGAFSINDVTAEGTVNSYIYTVEATYMSGAGSFSTVVVNGLTVYNMQSAEYLGNAAFSYEAQIKYAFNDSVINGAYVNISLPSGAVIGQVSSNATGWITFVLSQSNATSAGTYTVFGVNDNSDGITASVVNETFVLRSWTLNSKDNDGNDLSDTTLAVIVNSETVWSGADDVLRVPEDTFNITISWEGLEVNETTNLVISSDTVTDFNCLAYPYVYESVRYWVASDATVTSATWADDVLTVQFSGSPATYVLKASCTMKPSYILNCIYDYDVDWTTMLTLTHYANTTIEIGYPNWGGFYVKKTDYRLTNIGWVDQALSLTFTGSSGNIGEVQLYCASRGAPAQTSGFTTTSYSASAKTFVGTYTFESDKSVGVLWATSGTRSDGFNGQNFGSLLISINIVLQPSINAGTQVDGVIDVTWSGATIVYVSDVKFENFPAWFSVASLPYKLQKAFDSPKGESPIKVKVNIPSNAEPGDYLIPCTIIFRTESSQELTLGGTLKFQVFGAPSTIPDYMVLIFLSVFALILLGAVTRSKQKP